MQLVPLVLIVVVANAFSQAAAANTPSPSWIVVPGTAVTPDPRVTLFFLNPSHPSPRDVFGLQVLVNLLIGDGYKMTSHSNTELFRLIPTPLSCAPVVAATSVLLPTTRTGKNTGGFAVGSVAW